MRKLLNVISVLYFIWTLTVLGFIFKGKIVFGQGVGDLFYLVLLVIVQIVFGYVFFNSKNKIGLPIVMIVLLILCVALFTLKMTIYRGLEYPWNGSLFFE